MIGIKCFIQIISVNSYMGYNNPSRWIPCDHLSFIDEDPAASRV